MAERKATVDRNTLETQISVAVNLDGTGKADFDTGIPFLEHMLDQVARHGLIDLDTTAKKTLAAFQCIYSPSSKKKVREFLSDTDIDIAHVHNFFPRLSPSIFGVFYKCKIPSVLTLHNYRIICPTSFE